MLLERLKTAVPLIILVFLIFYLSGIVGKLLFAALAASLLFLAIGEIISLFALSNKRSFMLVLYLFSALLFMISAINTLQLNMFLMQISAEISLAILFFLTVFFCSFNYSPNKESIQQINSTLVAGFYITWTLCFSTKIYFLPVNGALLLAYLIVVAKMADVGAYFIGVGTAKLPKGNHKLATKVSPKKSWEGLLGAVIFSVASSLIFYYLAGENLFFSGFGLADNLKISFTVTDALLFGISSPFIGLLGDLAESAIKRAAGAKDSGNLPGLGGVLDMLDSIIPMAPLFYAWLLFKAASF